jgi:xanthine dehydrogenase accessory factor
MCIPELKDLTGAAMRKLNELIVLIRGGGEEGSAIAHRLCCCHFRICIAETANPLELNRSVCFSEAIYDHVKTIEGITGERTLPSMEHIYRVWREGKIPVLADPELSAKPLLRPDVLVNAMMLGRETSTRLTDAPLVIGIGPGFTAGGDVHMIIETQKPGTGKILLEGKSGEGAGTPAGTDSLPETVIRASEAGIFTTEKNLGDAVLAGDIIGKLGETTLEAPVSGILRGILRGEVKVLANARLAEIDPVNDKSVYLNIQDKMRLVSAGVLEAVMQVLNLPEAG